MWRRQLILRWGRSCKDSRDLSKKRRRVRRYVFSRRRKTLKGSAHKKRRPREAVYNKLYLISSKRRLKKYKERQRRRLRVQLDQTLR